MKSTIKEQKVINKNLDGQEKEQNSLKKSHSCSVNPTFLQNKHLYFQKFFTEKLGQTKTPQKKEELNLSTSTSNLKLDPKTIKFSPNKKLVIPSTPSTPSTPNFKDCSNPDKQSQPSKKQPQISQKMEFPSFFGNECKVQIQKIFQIYCKYLKINPEEIEDFCPERICIRPNKFIGNITRRVILKEQESNTFKTLDVVEVFYNESGSFYHPLSLISTYYCITLWSEKSSLPKIKKKLSFYEANKLLKTLEHKNQSILYCRPVFMKINPYFHSGINNILNCQKYLSCKAKKKLNYEYHSQNFTPQQLTKYKHPVTYNGNEYIAIVNAFNSDSYKKYEEKINEREERKKNQDEKKKNMKKK